uniref:Uncharacterized protein n=1 Tax=Virus NIOZ-UU159 TaxID=2763270 RepID=A0A7S9XGI1_9VIRU|nr:MAG: hypothetical protein NIOZUU159_00172 [Virus NIOZ-UU159]
MKYTINKLFIKNKYRTLYQKGNNYYYRYENKYHKITNKQLKFIGGVKIKKGGNSNEEAAEAKVEAAEAKVEAVEAKVEAKVEADAEADAEAEAEKDKLQIEIRNFVDEKRLIKYKILLFDKIIKYFKRIFNNDIIDSIKNSLNFLTKYNNNIDVLIDKYNHNEDGELNSTQIRMLITNIKKFIFEKIFVNYFIDIISKYYNENDMKLEIIELMHMLTFVEDDRKEEDLYKQKINILLDRLSDYSSKFKTEYSSKLNKFDETYQLLIENKNEEGEEEEKDEGEYDDMSLTNFLKVKQGILKEFKDNLEGKETKLIEMQQTIYWWDKLGPVLQSEFKVKDALYIKSLKIFFGELIRETIYKDLAIEELKNKRQSDDDDKMDPKLYNIYVDFLRNNFLTNLDNNDLNEEIINGDVSYEEQKKLEKDGKTGEKKNQGIKGKFKESIDDYIDGEIKTLEDELSELLKTKQKIIPGMMPTQSGGNEESISELRDNITNTKSKFQKMRKILIDKMLKYTDILLILAKPNKESIEDDKIPDMVTKQSFKDMAKTLILFLKQHILHFSEPFRKILNDIKRYHEKIMVEVDICDKLLREAENE